MDISSSGTPDPGALDTGASTGVTDGGALSSSPTSSRICTHNRASSSSEATTAWHASAPELRWRRPTTPASPPGSTTISSAKRRTSRLCRRLFWA